MRRLRIAIVALFILSGISFVGYNVISRLAEDHTPPEISCLPATAQATPAPPATMPDARRLPTPSRSRLRRYARTTWKRNRCGSTLLCTAGRAWAGRS